jgi:ABC-type phosphate transport system substrate-binding protein
MGDKMKKFLLSILITLVLGINLSAQVSVIANKSISEASLTSGKVGNIYSLEATKWADGSKITVFDNSSDTKTAFYSKIGKDQLSLKKDWMKKQLTGEAKAPAALGSDDDVLQKVASTKGAIGFVKSSKVSGDVKVLLELK